MINKLLLSVAALTLASTAGAVTTTTSTAGPDTQPLPTGQSIIYDFESGAPAGLTGNFAIVQGSTPNVYAAPLGDTTYYLAVPGTGSASTATLVLDQAYRTLSFYWGSIDAYNSVTYFNAAGTSLGTFSGDMILAAPADGSQGNALNNRRVNWDFGTDSVKSLTFTSTSPAFELDNIAGAAAGGGVRSVPEPTSWAMLITGISMVGFAARRRRASAVVA